MSTWQRLLRVLFIVTATVGATSVRAETVTYTYDAQGRLISAATASGATTAYSYDAAGNRTQLIISGGTNTAPVANTDTKSTKKNVTLNFDPRTNDTDFNNDTLTITVKTNGAHGTVTITGGGTGLRYVPAHNYLGSDTFTYTISDGTTTAVGTVNMSVTT